MPEHEQSSQERFNEEFRAQLSAFLSKEGEKIRQELDAFRNHRTERLLMINDRGDKTVLGELYQLCVEAGVPNDVDRILKEELKKQGLPSIDMDFGEDDHGEAGYSLIFDPDRS